MENPPFFYRCAGIWLRMEILSSIFPVRSLCVRSNFVLTVSVLFNENLQLLCETNLDTVREVMERKKPDVAVVDSIQTMFDEEMVLHRGVFLR